jgi:cytochrome c2
MRIGEIAVSGEQPGAKRPRERLLIVIALVGIVIWGFTGSWEYPEVETSVAVARDDDGRAAAPGGRAAAGAELFQANGCYACHSLDGERKIGPSLGGIFGATVELSDGSTALIDEEYLVESILQPEAKRVAGYDDAAMPSYEGIVSAEDASALAEYIKGLE